MILSPDGACSLPLSPGAWLTSSRGTWNVSADGTSVSNFQTYLGGLASTVTLGCETNNGDLYTLG